MNIREAIDFLNGTWMEVSEWMEPNERACLETLVKAAEEVASLHSQLTAALAERDAAREALQRIHDMSERPTCICGVPTGTAAIKSCARKAIDAARQEAGAAKDGEGKG